MPKHLWIQACLWVAYGSVAGSLATAAALWYLGFSDGRQVAGEFLLLAAFSLLGIVGGIALLGGQRWATVFLAVLAVPHLMVFPLGTALGTYTLWVFFRAKAAPTT